MTTSLSGKGTRRSRAGSSYALPLVSIVLMIAGASLFLIQLVNFSQQEDRLPNDIRVAGVEVGGMQPAQAVREWERALAQPIVLYYENSPILLDPASIGFRPNSQTMLAEALAARESEGSFWVRFFNHLTQQELQQSIDVPLFADYQQNLLEQFLTDISRRYDRSSGQAGYDVQTLTTFAGESGRVLNIADSEQLIDAALRNPDNRTISLPIGNARTARPDIATLEELITDYLDSQNFIYDGQTTTASVFILDLESGEEVNLLGDVAYSAASTMKLGILIDYFRYLNTPPSQEEAWLLANSLLCSRNSSSNLLMQILGGGTDIFNGIADVTETIQYLGARNSYISAPFVEIEGQFPGAIGAPETSPNQTYQTTSDPYNQTTAEDMGTLLSLIYDCATYGSGLITAYPDGEFTQTECRQMLELMSGNNLLRLLQGGIPENTRISHKNGWLDDMVGDAGIVYSPNGHNYVISVYLWEQTDSGFQDFQRLWPLVEGISRAAWNYFNPDQALLTPRADLPATAQACEGNYLPPDASAVNLDDIDAWRTATP